MSLSQFLRSKVALSGEESDGLLSLGAIYLNKKRLFSECNVRRGDYVRVHLEPRRYGTDFDWKKRIFFSHVDFLIIDKPPRLPVHPTLDNANENLIKQLERVLKIELFVTQRLDIPTSGLILIAKKKKFQTHFNEILLNRKVEKRYLALTLSPPPLGLHVHYMKPHPRSPKELSSVNISNWLRCELEILKVRQREPSLFESEVRLLTGRTHQIRAQFKYLKCPILNDPLYGAGERGHFGLRSFYLAFDKFQFEIRSWMNE